VPIYQTRLLKQYDVARNTIVCEFQRPKDFLFKPGQYGTFILPQASDVSLNDLSRRFSLLYSSDRNKIGIVTRMNSQSGYKQALQNLSENAIIKLIGPIGDFILHETNGIPAVFIAGGVGIAPFYSIISALNKQDEHPIIYLFYICRQIDDMPFFNEIKKYTMRSKTIIFVPILKKSRISEGEVGDISEIILRKYITNINEPYYYLCGSLKMVVSVKQLLKNMKIDENHVRIEDFPGY
jgi:ferredoxin-NADP reductase